MGLPTALPICFFQYYGVFGGADADRDDHGNLFLILSLILGVISLSQKIMGIAQEGFTTVIIVELLIGSLVMTSNGIIGYYIAKMYEEVKGRPRYIISAQK